MAYNPEKYREKREKVLGIRKRGLSFTVLAVIVSAAVFAGFGYLVIPPSLEWWQTRNLEDAIYRLQNGEAWPEAIVAESRAIAGVKDIVLDRNNTRLVVTFDKTAADPTTFNAFFEKKRMSAVLLNRIGHRHAMNPESKE